MSLLGIRSKSSPSRKSSENTTDAVRYETVQGRADSERCDPREVVLDELVRFRTVLDHAGEAIFIIDCDTRKFADLNETGARWLRRTRADILALSLDDLDVEFPLEPPEMAPEHLADTRGTTRAWTWAGGIHRRRNGTFFPVEVSISEHRLSGRRYWLVVARECSDRRTTEETLKEAADGYRTLFDLTPDAVYLTARDGTVVKANDAALDVFGYARSDLLGMHARLLYRDVEDIRTFQRIVEENGSVRDLPAKFARGDGSWFAGQLTAALRRAGDGSILGYQCVVRPTQLEGATVGESRSDFHVDRPSDTEAGAGDAAPSHSPGYESVETGGGPEDLPNESDATRHAAGVAQRSAAVQLHRFRERPKPGVRHLWPTALLLGLALSLLGWSGLASLGFPYASGQGLWHWLVRSVGAALLVLGGLGRKNRSFASSLAVTLFLLAAGLLTLGVEHISGLPFELTRVIPEAWTHIRGAILATLIFTVIHAGSFCLIAVYLLRSSRRNR
jgi:PAS domain S-box-containing protein